MKTITDARTGREYRILTAGECPSRKLYFSQDSFVEDDSAVVYLRYGSNLPDLRLVHVASGDDRLLVAGDDGACGSFGMAWTGDRGYFQRGRELMEIELSTGNTRPVAELPEGAVTLGHFTVSSTGIVANAVQLESKIYALISIEPSTGKVETLTLSDVRLGHCQICPTDDNIVFYVHETGGDALQRMWLFDRKERTRRPFFVEQMGDWITHETWHPSGEYMTFIKWPHAIMKGWANGQRFEVLAEGDYHHAAPNRAGTHIAADRTRTGEILILDAATADETVLVTDQQAKSGPDHCHPSFNRAGDQIVFSAPGGEFCQIGVVDVHELVSGP